MTKEFSTHTFFSMNGIIVGYNVICMEGWNNWQFYKYNVSPLLSAIVATLQLSVLSPQLSSDLTRALGWPQAGDWGVETIERVTIQSLSGLLAGWSHTSPHPGQYHVVSSHQVMVRSHHHHSDSEMCDDWMMIDLGWSLLSSQWPPQMSGAGHLPSHWSVLVTSLSSSSLWSRIILKKQSCNKIISVDSMVMVSQLNSDDLIWALNRQHFKQRTKTGENV